MTKIAGSGSISQRHGSADLDPHQNVMDLLHFREQSPICPAGADCRAVPLGEATDAGGLRRRPLQQGAVPPPPFG